MLKPRVGGCRASGRDRGLNPVHPSGHLGYGFGVGSTLQTEGRTSRFRMAQEGELRCRCGQGPKSGGDRVQGTRV